MILGSLSLVYKVEITFFFAFSATVVFMERRISRAFLRKERRNNRYVNPVEICPELNGKELTKEQLIEFATKIETIGSYLPTNIVSSRIKEVCNDVENEFENGNGFTF